MPRVVTIGPYHHGFNCLIPMEDHKLRYLEKFLQYDQKFILEDCIKKIVSWEDRARKCYDKPIYLSSSKFIEMMLVDGIFVIQLFLMYWNPNWRLDGDQIFAQPWMLIDIRRDMMLLENQMPFFAIEGLFKMVFGSHKQMPGLLELAYRFFKPATKIEKVPKVENEVKHLLDAIRLLYLPSKEWKYLEPQDNKYIPSATGLVAAGVKLSRAKSDSFDIKFINGVLEIPPLILQHTTESHIRNIIAFEQCYYPEESYMNDYMVFMDHLVNTPGDAKLLIDKKIIENGLGNEEAAAYLINGYCKDTFWWTRNGDFCDLRKALAAHCEMAYNSWKATLKRDYCGNPWAVISIIAGAVLLALTVVQTGCSILSL
ncbi:hypothetical protein BT93_C0875 [Corymbia citriodora subsp. variegata]|nr:hypothetical protein BT93_C0875 [Corymbia citriodora subsp. variegata]